MNQSRGPLLAGLFAVPLAMAATTLTAALAQKSGMDFTVPTGGEPIPLPGFAALTGVFSTVGVVIAVVLDVCVRQVSRAQISKRFVQKTPDPMPLRGRRRRDSTLGPASDSESRIRS